MSSRIVYVYNRFLYYPKTESVIFLWYGERECFDSRRVRVCKRFIQSQNSNSAKYDSNQKETGVKAIQVDSLLQFAQEALQKAGLRTQDAETVAKTLVATDTFGVFSHGTNNLYNYIRKIHA